MFLNNKPVRRGKAAQTIAEYSLLVAAVVMAATAMTVYAKRGLQGRYKDSVDQAQKAAGAKQYEPTFTSADTEQRYNASQQREYLPQETLVNDGVMKNQVEYYQNVTLDRGP